MLLTPNDLLGAIFSHVDARRSSGDDDGRSNGMKKLELHGIERVERRRDWGDKMTGK